MKRKSFARMPCSVARALEVVGDGWTLLVVRDLFYGASRFDELLEYTGIARNILTSRLNKLVADGVVEKCDNPAGGKRKIYRLTEKGQDLFTILIALMQWGDRWEADAAGPTLSMLDRSSGDPIPDIFVRNAQGDVVGSQDVLLRPGPGATRAVYARFAHASNEESSS